MSVVDMELGGYVWLRKEDVQREYMLRSEVEANYMLKSQVSRDWVRWATVTETVMDYEDGCEDGKLRFLENFVPEQFMPCREWECRMSVTVTVNIEQVREPDADDIESAIANTCSLGDAADYDFDWASSYAERLDS